MGYLLKDVSADELAEDIRSLQAGGSPISPVVARKILARAAASLAPATDTPAALSLCEQEVLRHVSKGFTTEETVSSTGVSSSTVQTFVRRIYAKLQVKTRAEAIHAAYRQGLLADEAVVACRHAVDRRADGLRR